MKIKMSPSLLAADFLHLESDVRRAEEAGADLLHCDVMDGVYVPNISFGFGIIGQIHAITRLPLDVHMMTAIPRQYIGKLAEIGASSVTLHTDSMPGDELAKALCEIRDCGMKAAAALRPKSPAEEVFPYLPYLDMVLVMTVEPGFGGQKFMADMMPKVRTLREELDRVAPQCEIQVDGGVGRATIEECAAAGANNFVIGTASFGAPDMKAALSGFVSLAEAAYRG